MTKAITDWSDEYDNVGHIPDALNFMENWPVLAETFRETADLQINIPYENKERNIFDMFHPQERTHLAAGPLSKNYAVAMPSYTLCPDIKISEITKEVTASIESISGVHDLRPILNITQNETINLSEDEAIKESPALMKPHLNIPVDCIVGGDERPEFVRQNDLLANVWRGMGVATTSTHIAGKHHFDVIDDLMSADGVICKTL